MIELDYGRQIARTLDRDISLADTNVVLVDQVDSASGPTIVRVARVDPILPASGDPALTILRRELREFLQCDLTVADPVMQALMTIVCGQLRGQ
jgi:hypothetical protein